MRSLLGKLRHHQPVTYQIKLLGKVGNNWSDWFDNMAVDADSGADGVVLTTLTGELPDQAALYGLLRKVSNLGLALISVNCLGSEPTSGRNKGSLN